MCLCVYDVCCGRTGHGVGVEIRDQCCGFGSLRLFPVPGWEGAWEPNSGHQACSVDDFMAEPLHWPSMSPVLETQLVVDQLPIATFSFLNCNI